MSISARSLPIDDDKDEADKPAAIDDAVITAAVKSVLGDRVSNVRASQRLTDSAACLVAEGKGPDRELERLLAMQDRGTGAKPVLEINTRHAVVKAISDAKLGGRDGDVGDLSELLYEQARILDGEVPDDPAAFAARLNRAGGARSGGFRIMRLALARCQRNLQLRVSRAVEAARPTRPLPCRPQAYGRRGILPTSRSAR